MPFDKGAAVSADSTDQEDQKKKPNYKWVVIGGGILAIAVVAALLLFIISRRGPAKCRGFDKCPDYPLPYEHKTWPMEYDMQTSLPAFPKDFVWGLGTAAYQIEGGYRDGGRGASIWDTFTGANTIGMPGANCSYCCKKAPCPINEAMGAKGATGNVACNHFNMWKDDIALMKSMKLKNYRFSISWPRIVPTGKVADGINEAGIKFYNDLIDGLIEAGITPAVTLYHWDLPQGLLDPPKKQGWWSYNEATMEPTGQITQDFVDYANVCFKSFGDRVKFWITFNEAWTFLYLTTAPHIAKYGNNSNESYIGAHNVLNAHAAAVDLYRKKYQKEQGGIIGITNNQDWVEPQTTDPEDIGAAERSLLHQLGWFSDPIFRGTGDYPESMRRILGDRLPKFTDEQKKLINGSADFYGLNTYATKWASNNKDTPGWLDAYSDNNEDGFPRAQSVWLYGAGWGFRKLLNWIDRRYHHIPIYLTESGWSLAANSSKTGVQDDQRLEYYFNATTEVYKAITEDGVDVRGYYAWSLMDNFEWTMGYKERFGLTYVDYAMGLDKNASTDEKQQPTTKGQQRFRKLSSCWMQAVWTTNTVVGLKNAMFEKCKNNQLKKLHTVVV